MNAPSSPDGQRPPAEEIAGRLLRLLRQGRGWPQREVAERMKASGYNWLQSTVGKTEAAQRPLLLNELAALAEIFGVPVTQFLEPGILLGDGDGFHELEQDIARVQAERARLTEKRDAARAHLQTAGHAAAMAAAELSRAQAFLDAMTRWRAQAAPEGGADPGEQPQP